MLTIILQFDLLAPLFAGWRRCRDRGCRCRIQNSETKEVNTKQLSQEDLNQLYTGAPLESHNVYAGNITFMLCAMMYCSGIPILYPFSFVFFTINYWMFKYLLLKYYRTTTEFNEHLAVNSIQWMQIGFVLHAVTTLMMYSNQDTMKFKVPSQA